MEVPALAKLTSVLQRTGQQHRFIEDLHMSPAWSEFQNNMGNNSIALSYCSDGFNPFHHIITQGSYSIWAQTGLILNLPKDIRTKIGTTMLFGLIPGKYVSHNFFWWGRVVTDFKFIWRKREVACWVSQMRIFSYIMATTSCIEGEDSWCALCWIFTVLAKWNNNLWIDMLLYSDTPLMPTMLTITLLMRLCIL